MRPCLTADNTLLSELKISEEAASDEIGELPAMRAINCTNGARRLPAVDHGPVTGSGCAANANNLGHADPPLDPVVSLFVDASLSDNSKRAYLSDLAHFQAWGGTIPASDRTVARYLAEHAHVHSAATLTRRLASLAKVHGANGLPSPTNHLLVKATLRGIKRRNGSVQRQARPLLRDDLFAALGAMGETPKELRDRALLLVGFAGGLRRSELVGLDHRDVEHVRQGLVIHLRRSKTDQQGEGRKIGIPLGRTRWCPVATLDHWLARSEIEAGPLFRSMNRHGHILDQRLSGEAVAIIVQERIAAAGFDPEGYSGHSLRAGFATSAAQAGVSSWKIRAQTGHSSDAMLSRYIRVAEMFTHNAASSLL